MKSTSPPLLGLPSHRRKSKPCSSRASRSRDLLNQCRIYRIERRHRTRVIADTYILFSDLEGFGRMLDAGPATTTVERILDALEGVICATAQEFGGTVRFNVGDSYCVTFAEAAHAIMGAERLVRHWCSP